VSDAFTVAPQWDVYSARVQWAPGDDGAARGIPAGGEWPRVLAWMGADDVSSEGAMTSSGGRRFAVSCAFGEEAREGQLVELRFYQGDVPPEWTREGTALALVERGDGREHRVVATGRMVASRA